MESCPLCKNAMILMNGHHIIPQAAGGTMGPIINICAMCHDAVHQCAIKVLAGKTSEANHIADSLFMDKKLAQRLVENVVQFTLKKKEGQVAENTINYKLMLAVPGSWKKYIKILAKDSHLSIVNYIINLVYREIKKNFPNFKR